MAEAWVPSLYVNEAGGGCRLSLAGCAHGYGRTLQEASDDLVRALLALAMNVRAGVAVANSTDAPRLDTRAVALMHELGRIAEQGGDIRQRLFGGAPSPRP